MKVKKYIKLLLSIMCITTLLGSTVLAVSNSDLTQINNTIKDKEKELDNVQAEKSEALQDIAALTSQITEYENQIEEMKEEIEELESNIEFAIKEIAEKEHMYEENYDKMVTRIVATYKKGSTSYLDAILSSKSITDVLSNWHYLSIITEADINFLESVQKSKNEIAISKARLENDKEDVEIKKKNVEKTTLALQVAEEAKKKQVNVLSESEKQIQAELDQYEKDKKRIEKELAEIAAREKYVVIGNPSSLGYIFPVSGGSVSRSVSNTSYPSYAGHTGVDVNIGVVGKAVLAVKAGTVEISTALYGSIANYDSNGNYINSYRSYGEYVVINHHDGTMTLYAHMKPGSRQVSVGQTVSQGQVIGTVGNTGNCLPRPTPTNYLNGTHLHFEVRVNGKCVNPVPYLL